MRSLFAIRKYCQFIFNLASRRSSVAAAQDSDAAMNSDLVKKSETRYNGRMRKRKWEDRTQRSQDDSDKRVDNKDETFVRVKKKKVAMLLGYSGVDYYGMQRNPFVRTIEGDLHRALLDAELITQEMFDDIHVMQFQRAARTDKGVSAARQVVSVKLPEEIDISNINQRLPPTVKIFAVKRVTKGFDSKIKCDARTYSYTLPTYAFHHQDRPVEDHKSYRVPPAKIEEFNEILKKFLGTRNFHNFTSRKYFVDPSAKRFIMKFECGPPTVIDGMEFATITVKGQSFMMHQIRKMVGLCLAIVRKVTDAGILEKVFQSERYDLPMAPGLGLVLDEVHYERYNARYGEDGFHETLTWEEVDGEVRAFRDEFILPTIVKTEMEQMPMAEWLETLPKHSYDVRTEQVKDDETQDFQETPGEVTKSD